MQLIWFRNDLRVKDNPALYAASNNKQQPLVAVFCYCAEQWQHYGIGVNHQALMLQQLFQLQTELKALNIPLVILDGKTFSKTPKVMNDFCQAMQVQDVYFNVEYAIDERCRDKELVALLQQQVECHRYSGDSLVAPWRILNEQKNPYKVYSAFARKLRALLLEEPLYSGPAPAACGPENLSSFTQKLATQKLADIGPANEQITSSNPNQYSSSRAAKLSVIELPELMALSTCKITLPKVDYASTKKRLRNFSVDAIYRYAANRDIPSLSGTSGLSAALSVGAISVTECYLIAKELAPEASEKWLSELIWRDFYRAVMWHFPQVSKNKAFNPLDSYLDWTQQSEAIQAFFQGETGLPIIDAAIKQLLTTGWMHNRLRMITASYFCKNLWGDWRLGEAFFAQHLFDYDFANNNGGWQWCASVGTDAAPYFRVFNPQSQQKNYDPDCTFIKSMLPQLTTMDAKAIHNFDKKPLVNYPEFTINLKTTRKQAIEEFKNRTLWYRASQQTTD